MDFSNDLKKVLSIIARVVRGWKVMEENVKLDKNDPKAIEMLTVPPRPNALQFSEKLVLLTAIPETVAAHKEKKLDSLIPKYDGKIIVTTGEKSMSSLLGGKSALPVLMPTICIRAAHLYMTRANCGEDDLVHRTVVETLARSRVTLLLRHEEFVARKGSPIEIISDQESQLVAAGDIVNKENPKNWKLSDVQEKNSITV